MPNTVSLLEACRIAKAEDKPLICEQCKEVLGSDPSAVLDHFLTQHEWSITSNA